MIVTRFNPSCNGPLHLGHVFTLLVNEQFAHQSDGKFIVRFDDITPPLSPEQNKKIKIQQRETIEWLNVKVDGWIDESSILDEVRSKLDKLGHVFVDDFGYHELPIFTRHINTSWLAFPYVPQQTAERVVMDNMYGTTHLIRGEEFALEYSHYRLKCDEFKMPAPKFIFIPRLMGKHGDISKTAGGYSIAELRGNGYTPKDVIELVERACLNWYPNGWSIYNLKREPRLSV